MYENRMYFQDTVIVIHCMLWNLFNLSVITCLSSVFFREETCGITGSAGAASPGSCRMYRHLPAFIFLFAGTKQM
ncbi:hypothetical protein XELAEV_18028029mg [Xenopus laevis]|uniref:Uncharacterized protein n=1 Tax=Xenopus laevis TaxID=8355 RepID=A0A974HKJ9_XENLA|nr:hypothetical protein XELAEV_18028029mg [Xenopus laevis]